MDEPKETTVQEIHMRCTIPEFLVSLRKNAELLARLDNNLRHQIEKT